MNNIHTKRIKYFKKKGPLQPVFKTKIVSKVLKKVVAYFVYFDIE